MLYGVKGATRRTVAVPVSIDGVGMHTGVPVTVTFAPADPGTGVTFVRADLAGAPQIPAALRFVSAVDRRTRLTHREVSVSTVEHLLAAVAALGLDDLTVELTGPEPPAVDGSAGPFFDALAKAGVAGVEGTPRSYRVGGAFEVTEGESRYEIAPDAGLDLTVHVDWSHPAIGSQTASCRVDGEAFGRGIARARTFGFVHEVEALRSRGLALGASTACAIVLDDTSVVNGPLRWPDEFARHKLLDLVGDLALLGGVVHGRVTAWRPGHRGNIELARAIERHCANGE